MSDFNGIEEPSFKTREYFSPHMENVLANMKKPLFLKDLYKLCRSDGVPDSSVRRILSTFKSEKLVEKKNGKWQRRDTR